MLPAPLPPASKRREQSHRKGSALEGIPPHRHGDVVGTAGSIDGGRPLPRRTNVANEPGLRGMAEDRQVRSKAAFSFPGALLTRRREIVATVADPLAYAGHIIEWAEREHLVWFWRCCREHHVL